LTLALFIVLPFLAAIISLYRAIKNRDYYFCAFIVCLFAGLYGYTFSLTASTPDVDADIIRLYMVYEDLVKMPFSEAWTTYIFSNGDLSYFYFWCLARIGLPAQSLGFIASAVLYGSIFFIMKKTTKIFNRSRYSNYFLIGVLLIFFLIHPLFFSSIRSAIAIPLFVLAILNFIDNQKKWAICLCLLSASIHFSMLPFVILFFVNSYASKRTIRLICWCLFFAWILYYPLFYLVLGVLNLFSDSTAIAVLISKIESYVFNWDSAGQFAGLSTGSRFFTIQRFLLVFVTIYYALNKRAKDIAQSNRLFYYLRRFIILFLLALLFFSYNLVALGRYLELGVFICVVYLISYGLLNPSKKYNSFMFLLLSVIVLLGTVAIVREGLVEGVGTIGYENVPSLFSRNLFYLLNIHP
jgi:hypothetical protein